jgi:tripartite-type tricarboxylate transporter receptor subunit TctC
MVCGPVNAINTTLYDRLPFNFSTDIVPVSSIVRVPLVMLVNSAVPARSVSEFIAYAKSHPRQINIGSGGNGTPQHVAAELFKMMAGVDMVHIPYRGTAVALNDLLGGQVQVMFEAMPAVGGHIQTGRIRALAVTTSMRSTALPDLPTVADFVPGYDAYSWYGVGAPRQTPAAVISLLNLEINAALADDRFKARLLGFGGTPLGGTTADFSELIAAETEK